MVGPEGFTTSTRAFEFHVGGGDPDRDAHRVSHRELRHEAVEKYHAIEGGQQTLSNLAAYVTEIVRKGVEGW